MEITSSAVLPVSDAQMTAFSAWVINKYVTYDEFIGAIKSPEIDTYIKTHILPQEMVNALRISERYMGEKWGDVTIQWMLLNRRRVTAKMNNLKGKIGFLTFPIEATQARRANRNAATGRRLAREAALLREQQLRSAYDAAAAREAAADAANSVRILLPFPDMKALNLHYSVVKTILTKEDADTCIMDDDCVVCMAQHKMTDACVTNCGHQFGSACLAAWKKNTCPLCRTTITEVTEFSYEVTNLVAFVDQERSLFDQVMNVY
jgi:hypothetical protein